MFVDDIAAAFLLTTTCAGIDGCSIDLGSGTLTSMRDDVNSIVQLTNTQIDPHSAPFRIGRASRRASGIPITRERPSAGVPSLRWTTAWQRQSMASETSSMRTELLKWSIRATEPASGAHEVRIAR